MPDIFTISSPALPSGTHVVGFRGSEGISRLYAFEIHLSLAPGEADGFELPSAVGAKATLTLDRQDGRRPFAYHGIFSEVAIVHHEPDGRAFVRAMLVPRLWLLTQTFHSRIFTQQAIPDILKQTLEDGGLSGSDYSLQLTGEYATEEHVCQYRESHFDFISRWMEREGIYYFFEQGDDGEKLIVADAKSAHADLPPKAVRYFALLGYDATAGECLQTFVCRQRALPASVRFKDYDHTKPSLDVSGKAPVSASGVGEISVYGARFFTPDAGKRLAELRAQEMLAREQVFTGSGTAFFLRAGYTFDLQDHPRAAFDAKYLVTEVEHFGNQSAHSPAVQRLTGITGDEVYRVEVTGIPATVQFRAEQRAPWPRIYGTEHGTIDGEADSQYAQLDDHGRYFVRFAFDESDLGPGKASTRVRMMQPHGGGVEGFHFPLRKGTEVLFTFLGGDPDRPVIAGVVPNTEQPSPVTKGNQTKNVIQTGGNNRIEIEDKEGSERIKVSTPFKNTVLQLGAPNAPVQGIFMGTDKDAVMKAGETMTVNAGEKIDIAAGINLNESAPWVDIGAGNKINEHAPEVEIHGASKVTVDGQLINVNAGGNLNETAPWIDISGGAKIRLGAPVVEVGGATEVQAHAPSVNLVASSSLVASAQAIIVVASGAVVNISAGAVATVTAPVVNVSGSGAVNVTGGVIKLN